MTARRGTVLGLMVVLVGTWLLLQGEVTVGNLIGGALVATALVLLFPVHAGAVGHRLRPWGFVRFVGFVLWSLVLSSWEVIKVVVRPTPVNLRAGIVRVRLEHESELTATIVANAVTLTPGTMTLTARLDPAELHIHVLGLADAEEFRASVRDLEQRTVAAIQPFSRPGAGEDPT